MSDYSQEFLNEIPNGYEPSPGIDIGQLQSLAVSVGWESSLDGWKTAVGNCLFVVGVRDDMYEKLVGVGFLVGNNRHAVLCDLMVDPEHQGRGIAKAIVNERFRRARDLGIPFLYTELAMTNPMRRHYENLGFWTTGRSLFYEPR